MRRALAYGLVAGLYLLISAEVIDLMVGGADLGRHIRNGEGILSGAALPLLHTNYYSYTHPDYPFVNHHWLSGVVYYSIWKVGGFAGLNAVHLAFGAAAVLLFFRLAEREAGLGVASALAVLLMPILRARASIRPEMLSFLLAGIFLTLLWRRSPRSVFVLPVLMALWVNLHIGFAFGVFLVAVFAVANPSRRAAATLALVAAATLLNPSGFSGAIYPLAALRNYGFSVAENQPALLLQRLGYRLEFGLIYATVALLVVSFAVIVYTRRKPSFELAAIAAAATLLSLLAVRNRGLLALFALPILAHNAAALGLVARRRLWSAVLVFGFLYTSFRIADRRDVMGLDLAPGINAAADFFRTRALTGPVFNNFNIGGYLIYHVFPRERVFVDNRPEAYPADFFEFVYTPAIQDERVWAQLNAQRGFNVIFFSRGSREENAFVASRAGDPAWAPVFVDANAIIFLRRTVLNQSTIDKCEVPRERFLRSAP